MLVKREARVASRKTNFRGGDPFPVDGDRKTANFPDPRRCGRAERREREAGDDQRQQVELIDKDSIFRVDVPT